METRRREGDVILNTVTMHLGKWPPYTEHEFAIDRLQKLTSLPTQTMLAVDASAALPSDKHADTRAISK